MRAEGREGWQPLPNIPKSPKRSQQHLCLTRWWARLGSGSQRVACSRTAKPVPRPLRWRSQGLLPKKGSWKSGAQGAAKAWLPPPGNRLEQRPLQAQGAPARSLSTAITKDVAVGQRTLGRVRADIQGVLKAVGKRKVEPVEVGTTVFEHRAALFPTLLHGRGLAELVASRKVVQSSWPRLALYPQPFHSLSFTPPFV